MKPKLSRPGSCSFRAVLLALALVAAPAFAQLVSDSATNTLNNVTNNVGGALTVGTNGANTRLNLVNGAVVTDTTAVIGQNPTSTNNVVSVMGTNTIWSNSVSLDVRRGSVLFEGGTIFAGSLLLTNGGGAGGFFLFDQGTLVTTSASISNGQAFVVGANAATPSATFRDTNAIIIPISVTSYVAALTYPAVMNVSNLIGSITKVTVTLSNFTHAMERDVHVLLVGPRGQKVILMSNAGGTNTTSPDLIFDDAGAPLPLTPLVDGTYQPTDYAGAGNELPPAPARPYGTNLSTFLGTDANGTWSLYVTDTNGPANAGGISNGWALNFTMTQQAAVWDVRTNATATTVAGSLDIGSNASNARLLITNGASLLVGGSSSLGDAAGSASNVAIVSGPGSLWATSNDLNVGSLGTRNQLIVSNGGRVSALNGILGTTATADTNSALVTGAGSVWTNGTLTVGGSGSLSLLVVSNGGRVDGASLVRLGQNAGSANNTVIVNGAGSVLRSGGNLYVGESGALNTLVVTNGGAVFAGATAATSLIVGSNAGSVGNLLTVGGATSTLTVTNSSFNAALDVRRGSAVLNGGTITADRLLLPAPAGSFTFNGGTLITRVGTIANGNDFIVGNNPGFGPATWDVRSNATITTVVGGDLIIGQGVTNSTLLVTNGATLQGNGSAFLGNTATSPSNLAVIARSRWNIATFLYVGGSSAGNQLVISNGGQVGSVLGSIIGANPGADNNLVLVTGTNSVWSNAGSLYMSQLGGTSNQLIISNGGGFFNNGFANVGSQGGTNSVLVTGANSYWSNVNDIHIGDQAASNQLTISVGGQVVASATYLGFQGGSFGNSALVTGSGSLLTNSGTLTIGAGDGTNQLSVTSNGLVGVGTDFFVGAITSGNQLLITNGGIVLVSGVSSIGLNGTGTTNLALVSGAGSVWSNLVDLAIGGDGSGNRLTVSNGGVVNVAGNSSVGRDLGGTNTAVVTGVGSVWTTGGGFSVGNEGAANLLNINSTGLVAVTLDFIMGNFSGTNQLIITNGGVFQVGGNSLIGTNVTAAGNVALVSGSNSIWTNAGNLYIGQSGTANRLTVSNGGRLFTGALADIGSEAGGNNNNAMITGTNSLWSAVSNLNVGNLGANNQFTVSNGATVIVGSVSTIGAGANGNRAVVTGTNSVWSNAVGLIVGNVGANNQLAISNGGVVFSALGQIGIAGNNNLALVSSNSVWNSPTLQVGAGSTGNQLVVSNGGVVNSSFGQIGAAGNNNLAIVTGTGLWNSTTLEVGITSTGNQLFLTNGGGALSTDGFIGSSNGANTATTTIYGPGSYWSNANSLTIGNLGNLSRLVLVNGGTAFASNSILLGAAATSGRVLIQGGTLRAANSAINGTYEVRTGTNQFDSGLVDVDFLLLTNAGNQFTFNGGTLITRGALLSNGSPFAVGAGLATGTNAAVFANPAAIVLDDQTNLATPYPSTIVASNLVGPTAKITVTLSNFTAGLPSDVDILVRAPSGQAVVLMSGAGTNIAVTNLTLTFDATAATAITDATNLTNGTFRPADYPPLATFPAPAPGGTFTTNLAFFNGLDPNGTWSLFVIHGDTNFIGGISNGWSIAITTSNLPPATWDVRSNPAPAIVASDLYVGSNAPASTLLITNGGRLLVSGVSTLGQSASSGTNSALIAGANSTWASGSNLVVGNAGALNQLTVSTGAVVANVAGVVGATAASASNRVVVTGTNSLWTNSGTLTLGSLSAANSLVVSNGGVVVALGGATLGAGPTASNNSAVVTGTGSALNAGPFLNIGDNGTGNSLAITNGGAVTASNQVLVGVAGVSNFLTIGGGTLTVTNAATNGLLEVRRGSAVFNGGLVTADQLVLTNPGSLLTFNGGTLVTRGAVISNGLPFVVGNSGTNPATWDVRFSASNSFVGADIYVGSNASFNRLLVTNGALLTNTGAGYLGFAAGANSNAAVLAGAGSQWLAGKDTAGNSLYVGSNGAFSQLIISNGALLTSSGNSVAGQGVSSSNNLIAVNGAGSVWSNAGNLILGAGGARNTLVISNGGAVFNANALFGSLSGSSNNSALVTDAGSTWSNAVLNVGSLGSFNTLTVSNGGTALSTSASLGSSALSVSNVAAVTGAGSVWSNLVAVFDVGNSGSGNRLVISNGGRVFSTATFVGDIAGSSNNSVLVTGAGSAWSNTISIFVGNAGVGNTAVITNGGAASASNTVAVGGAAGSSNNLLTVGGGTLTVTNVTTNGLLDVRRGSAVFNGGLIAADQLVLTNAGGTFTFNGGTLVTRGAVVTNGLPFVVGASGTNPATWDVRFSASNSFVGSDIFVGSNSSLNSLLVTNGARLTNTGAGQLGFAAGANSNAAVLAGAGSQWLAGKDAAGNSLYVGSNGAFNQLVISNGATLTSSGNSVAGLNAPSSNNLVAVVGAGSVWSNAGNLTIGSSASRNSLIISNGGAVFSTGGFVGAVLNTSNNVVLLTDAGSIWTNSNMLIGQNGSFNTLTVSNGALLVTAGADVGSSATAAGNVAVVTGAGSVWSNYTGILNVGNAGPSNQLVISNGGRLAATTTIVGNSAGSTSNTALVTGAGSVWSNSISLIVGTSGAGNSVLLTNGGLASAATSVQVGVLPGSSNNTLTVSGGTLLAANVSANALLDVRRGGAVLNGGLIAADQLVLTNGAGTFTFNGGTLLTRGGVLTNGAGFVVGGPGTNAAVWDLRAGVSNTLVSGNIFIGSNVSFATLLVTNGAVLTNSGAAYVGFALGANSNTATLAGVGSRWFAGQDAALGGVYVGSNGAFNTLVVSNGAKLNSSGAANVGFGPTASNNVATITGAGSAWTNAGALFVGNAGLGNSLLVSGGVVFTAGGTLGSSAIASGNLASVSGAGAMWSNSGTLLVGDSGSFNTLVVSNGGVVFNASTKVGSQAGATNNLAVVTGAGSIWSNTGSLIIGGAGAGNTLLISAGARVINPAGSLGSAASASNNLASVSGIGSVWTNSGSLLVGAGSAGNTLVISNSGVVFSSGADVGSSGNNNLAVVTGAGSVWTNFGVVNVGNSGGSSRNQLVISNGGVVVTATGGVIGNGSTSSANLALVNGAGSVWTNGALLTVGASGSTNTLVVSNAGTLFSVGGLLGGAATASNNFAVIVGTNSVWSNSAALLVGSNGPLNTLIVSNGGVVVSVGGSLGVASTSNLAVVTGPGSLWSNTAAFNLGVTGAVNSLVVSNGGRFEAASAVIGSVSGATNNSAFVSDSNSVLRVTNGLTLGSDGANSRLTVTNGGTLLVGAAPGAGLIVGATANSTNNLLAIGNATLTVSNVTTNAVLDVRRGSVVLNGGTLNANQLLATNGAASLFTLNAGTVNVSSTTISNGFTFLVGNGVSNAAYHLVNSNTHSFGNGLVINTNATLFGNGTIVGNVTNRGTITPGNSPGSLTINGSLSFATNAGITFEIGGLIPTNQYDQVTVTNFVQFAGTLSLALINNFTPAATSTFTLMNFASASGTFANATNNAVVATTNNLAQFRVSYSATNLVLTGFTFIDSDGDGQPDYAESLAGTLGNNSADYFHVTTMSRALSGAITVQFAAVAGKSYVPEYSNDLVTWTQAVGATLTNPGAGILQWIDDGTLTGGVPTSKRFYRIRLVVP